MKNRILSICMICLWAGFCCFYPSVLRAQISLDGTMGISGSLSGPNYNIESDAGKQVGNNLFHSFGEFNINKGESATFRGPDSISTIISRVTGGKASLIDGRLISAIPDADMFFLNPSGIMFGKNALIDIRGSFHVTTADYLRLKDGGRFDASDTANSLLTASPPSAFGFLQDHPADISVNGGILSVPESQTLTVAGGDVAITDKGILDAKGGQINIVSTASSGEAVFGDSAIDTTFNRMGNILISEGSRTDVSNSDDSSGKIYIRGGRFEVKGQVSSVSWLPENGSHGEIDIRISDDLLISGQISAASNGNGHSGNIRLDANRLKLTGNGRVFSGNISVTARESVSISGDSGLSSDAIGDGDAGNISITTGDLTVTDKGLVSSVASGNGHSGDIALNTGRADISYGGTVLASSFGSGKAGNISIDAFESLRLAGTGGLYSHAEGQIGTAGNISVSTGNLSVSDDSRISTSSNGDGAAGDIEIKADRLNVTKGGVVITAGYGPGPSGDISVRVADSAEISGSKTSVSGLSAQAYGTGDAGDISLTADNLTVADEALLSAEADGTGIGGNISLETGEMKIIGGGEITTGTEGAVSGGDIRLSVKEALNISGVGKTDKNSRVYTYTQGGSDAGNISVSAGTVTVGESGSVASSTSAFGNAGSVKVETEELDLIRGGRILSGTSASGHGGDISVGADKISISGTESGIYAVADSDSNGNAGNITISGKSLIIADKGRIADQTYSKGQGGDITADAEQMKVMTGGSITTDTSGMNDGGDISLTARESLMISESGEISAKTLGGTGNAGNITIDSGLLFVSDNGLINNGTLGRGSGGDIRLNADRVELNKGYISSGSENEASGHCGDIAVNARETITVAGSGNNDDGGPHAEYYGIYSQTQGAGNGGNITLSADEMNIVKDGWINGQTYGAGQGGNVVIDVNRLNVREGGTVTASTRCSGSSGDISIAARESVTIAGAGAKQPNSWIYTATHSSGSGGNLSISTPVLNVGENGLIYADTLGDDDRCSDDSGGRAGNISLDTDRIELSRGGSVSAGTQTQGKGGDISISARESVSISGSGIENKDSIKNSGIYASARSAGKGGIIRLSTDSLTLSDSAEINTSASETGAGGNIELEVRQSDMNSKASVTAESSGTGKAGNISVNASGLLKNDGGRISTESAESQGGSITINTPLLSESENGIISASVTGGAKDGGDIKIVVYRLDLDSGSHVASSDKGLGKGGELHINAFDAVNISGKDSGFYSKAYSSGDAGLISIATPYLTLRDHAEISTESLGSGKAGNIRLEDRLRNLVLKDAAVTSSNSGTGDAGQISIRAEESLILESGSVLTEASEGRGGSISIMAPLLSGSGMGSISASVSGSKAGGNVTADISTLTINSGFCIESSTDGAGQGGEVLIRASDSVSLSGDHTGIYSKAESSGDAGLINVATPYLTLGDRAEISTESLGSGKAGNIGLEDRLRNLVLKNASVTSSGSGTGDAGEIGIRAEESLILESGSILTEASEGRGGSITITAPLLSGSGRGSISASVSGSKNGGDVTADVSTMALDSGFRIESSTRGAGHGGYVNVKASDTLTLSGKNTGLYSTADSSGDAGHITAAAPDLTLTDAAAISTESSSTGKAGDIVLTDDIQRLGLKNASVSSSNTGTGDAGKIAVNAKETVLLESGSVTTAAKEGKGGNITVTTHNLSVSGEGNVSAGVQSGEKEGGRIEIAVSDLDLGTGSRIESSSGGKGNAGDIVIRGSDMIRMLNGSAITTEADFADGGNISVNARSGIFMTDSDITATVRGGKGDGGNISIDPELVLLKNSRIIADAYGGKGGNVNIKAGMFVRTSDSRVSASSQLGIEGSVEIESSRADIGGLTALPSDIINNRPWLQTLCPERSDKKVSRFVSLGRDALPTAPDDWLASPPLPFDRTEIRDRSQAGAWEREQAGSAAELLVKGEEFYLRGDFIHAVQSWEQAIPLLTTEKKYTLSDLICVAYAYQSLGYHEKSLSLFDDSVSEFEKNPLFLSALGDLLLSLGKSDDAERLLRKAADEARLSRSPDISASVLNNRGNLFASQGDYLKAEAAYSESLKYIEQADRPGMSGLKSKVLINMAHAGYMQESYKDAAVLADKAFQHTQSLRDSYYKASDFISLAMLARKIRKAYPAADKPMNDIICRALDEAGRIAGDIQNISVLSQACGYLGQFYEDGRQYDQAIQLTRRALFFAQQGNFPEIMYLWQWQLGRLFKAEGDMEKSLNAYYEAISTLKPIRKEFFKGFRGSTEMFYEKLKPVYLELTGLLLKQAEAVADGKRQAILKDAVNIMEMLKSAELQNYFEDECLTAKSRKSTEPLSISSHSAVIYPILFGDHLTVLLTLSEGIKQFRIPANAEEIKKRVAQFRERLQDGSKMNRILYQSKPLYDLLIRPLESELTARNIDTLIIAPDSVLHLIPFAALHDGHRFLIEKYAVVTIPGISLTDTEPVRPEHSRVLLNGLSEGVQGFDPLPGVEHEFEELKKIMKNTSVFLNETYTADNLFQEFRNHDYDIVFMATHGVFGGTGGDSFLLTYNGRLTMNQMEDMIALGKQRDRQIGLLMLNACQTAISDERAALGLGGIALKAGAKSAVATLWSVCDESAFRMITEFYRQICIPGMSKAKALQNAQKIFIAAHPYSHPTYWSPFLLIGNWS